MTPDESVEGVDVRTLPSLIGKVPWTRIGKRERFFPRFWRRWAHFRFDMALELTLRRSLPLLKSGVRIDVADLLLDLIRPGRKWALI